MRKMTGDKHKRKIYNLIMVVAVAVILFSGVMIAFSIKGGFDKPAVPGTAHLPEQSSTIIVKDKIGSANIERAGIAYSLKNKTRLKNGDVIETLNRSSITIEAGENKIALSQNSKVQVHIDDNGEITLALKLGDVFAQVPDQIKWKLMDVDVTAINTVFGASAPSGSARISVFENSVQIGDKKIEASKAADIFPAEIKTTDLSIKSLNEFYINHIRKANAVKELCFTNSDLDKLESERMAEIKAAKEAKQDKEIKDKEIGKQQGQNKDKKGVNEGSGNNSIAGGSGPTSGSGSGEGGAAGGNASTGKPSDNHEALKCTIEIRCDTILNNMDQLETGKNGYVPADGTILSISTMEFEEGDTVFNVLKRVCELAGIQLEYSWTPIYNSYYIEGINNLYEFDCGNESGWMYKVNGWFPNYGCSAYTLKDGDTIVWCYTCKGFGADVGGGV